MNTYLRGQVRFDATHQSPECFDAVKRPSPHPHHYHVTVELPGEDPGPLTMRLGEIRAMLDGHDLNQMIPGNSTTRVALAAWFVAQFMSRVHRVTVEFADDLTVVVEMDQYGL